MRKLLLLFLVVALVAFVGAGAAFADKPDPGETGNPPQNPPCDSDHGHPLANLLRLGKDCPPGHNGGGGGNGDGNGDGGAAPSCDDPDGDGTNHSNFDPDSNEGGPVSSIVHQVDQAAPSPLGGDGGVVTEVNCAIVVTVEEILGING